MGMSGMFWLMVVLGLAAIAVVMFGVPTPPPLRATDRTSFMTVLKNPDLLRLNVGVLALHAAQVAMFMVVPSMLTDAGINLTAHWTVYLPVVLVSFVVMLPPMIWAERYGKVRQVLLSAVALLTAAQLLFAQVHGLWPIAGTLLLFFIAFNILEAMQPSLVTRFAQASRGAALGIYNTTQALGMFIGGAVGGILLQQSGRPAVFYGCAVALGLWLIIAWNMKAPPARARRQSVSA